MSFWGTLGKTLLKVAPYAAMAIPGVGIPLGMAISGGLGVANAKASGGSWKNALLQGGIGAGLGAVGAGALKGIGPTSGTMAKILGGAGGVEGLGVKGAIGKTLGDMGRNVAASKLGQAVVGPEQQPQQIPMNAPNAERAISMFQPTSSSFGDSIFAGRENARKRLAFQ